MNKRTVYSPAHVEMGGEIYKAIRAAMRMREDNFKTSQHPFALASKMASEIGHAMYGLNTWSEGRHEEGDRLAEMCRKTHNFVMDLLEAEIRQIVDGAAYSPRASQRKTNAEFELAKRMHGGMSNRQIVSEIVKERKIG
jgi:uncharacterized protein YicC (UPF0701 family)